MTVGSVTGRARGKFLGRKKEGHNKGFGRRLYTEQGVSSKGGAPGDARGTAFKSNAEARARGTSVPRR